MTQSHTSDSRGIPTTTRERRRFAFSLLTRTERKLLTAALAGNHPPSLDPYRAPILRALAAADIFPADEEAAEDE